MGIYIPGMEMPKEGTFIAIYKRGDVFYIVQGVNRCPLIPVSPHGDLIDCKQLTKSDHQHYEHMSDEFYVTVRDIENAPTIIPAEDVTL